MTGTVFAYLSGQKRKIGARGHERRSAAFLNVLGAVGLIAGAMPGSGSAFAQDKNKQVYFLSWGGKP